METNKTPQIHANLVNTLQLLLKRVSKQKNKLNTGLHWHAAHSQELDCTAVRERAWSDLTNSKTR